MRSGSLSAEVTGVTIAEPESDTKGSCAALGFPRKVSGKVGAAEAASYAKPYMGKSEDAAASGLGSAGAARESFSGGEAGLVRTTPISPSSPGTVL